MILLVDKFLIVIAAVIHKKSKTVSVPTPQESMPVKRRKLLTEAEANFYQVLRSMLPEEYDITCKCRLEDIMFVAGNQQKYRNRIKSRHVDFVIFEPNTGKTRFAIELDDQSHNKKTEEDKFKDELFRTIGMELTRVKVRKEYTKEEIENILLNGLRSDA